MPLIYALLLFCILGCARSAQKAEEGSFPLKNTGCPANHIRGTGLGENKQEALAQARTDISSQIRLSITSANESSQKLLLSENKELLESMFKSDVKQTTELLNAQDAKLQATKQAGEKVAVVACMSREDAAKPYLGILPRINDSLSLAIQTELVQNHPRAKREAARAAESLRMRQIMTVQILQGLGKNAELQNSTSYEKMIKDYEEFSSGFKFIWEGDNEQLSQILVSKISSRYKIETGDCAQGLKLIPTAPDIFCEYSRFGPQCSYLPALEGRSCKDELYFTLKGQMVRGTGERDKDDAMRKLFALIPKAPFWNNWFEELDKYGGL